ACGLIDGFCIPNHLESNRLAAPEVVIQPPPSVLTIPGPILSASCEPVSVGGNTPCAVGGYGYGYGRGLFGDGYGYFGKRSLLGGRSGICSYPC
uniref:Keratin n=1 Tax=Podarcis muralis TaxID=64176 RepID=A0A670JVR6_PODMU